MFEDVDEVIMADMRGRRRWCGFTKWARTLEPADASKAEALVADRDYDCRALARYFQTKGAEFNDQVISRHRNQQCCRTA